MADLKRAIEGSLWTSRSKTGRRGAVAIIQGENDGDPNWGSIHADGERWLGSGYVSFESRDSRICLGLGCGAERKDSKGRL